MNTSMPGGQRISYFVKLVDMNGTKLFSRATNDSIFFIKYANSFYKTQDKDILPY